MRPTISNATLASIDWAAAERQAFLRGIPKVRRRRDRLLAGLPARGVWMTDVSAIDRRSVKAYLMGRGDYRVWWWQLNYSVHRLLLPGASLEQVMCAFHQRHHAMTIARLTLVIDYVEIFQAIRQRGVRAGMQRTIGRFRCPPGEQCTDLAKAIDAFDRERPDAVIDPGAVAMQLMQDVSTEPDALQRHLERAG